MGCDGETTIDNGARPQKNWVMTIPRRKALQLGILLPVLHAATPEIVEVPVILMTNKHSNLSAQSLKAFRSAVWDEAVNAFSACGVHLKIEERTGEVLKYPGGRPRFIGLDRNCLNIVLTDHIPLSWDQARFSAGIARIYEGCHLCLIAVQAAHGNRVPFLALNSVVHELLHVFLQDIYAKRGEWLHGYDREARVDWHATRLWLFRDGGEVKRSAAVYVKRLRG